MIVLLLKTVFFVLSTLSNLITRLIFTATAHVLVKLIQMLKVQGEGSQMVLEQVRDMIKALMEYLIGFVIQEIKTIVSSLFNLVKEEILSTPSAIASAVAGLIEKSSTMFNGAVEDFPELLNAFLQMVSEITTGLLKNCQDAVGYVVEKAVN